MNDLAEQALKGIMRYEPPSPIVAAVLAFGDDDPEYLEWVAETSRYGDMADTTGGRLGTMLNEIDTVS